MPTSPRPSSSRREMPIFTYSGVSPLRAGISPVDSSLLRCCSGHRVPPDTQWLISTRGLKGWNPENQQKDDESRCFLEEIPPHKECAVHGRLASTSPGGKSSEAAVSNFKAFPLKLPSPGSRAHPCLSDFLRLSPSVFSPALPPSSPTRVPVSLDRAPGRHFFLVPLSLLSLTPLHALVSTKEVATHFRVRSCFSCFISRLNLQRSARFRIFVVRPPFKRLHGIFSPLLTAHNQKCFLTYWPFCALNFHVIIFLSHRRADNDTGEKVRLFDFVFQSSALTSDVV